MLQPGTLRVHLAKQVHIHSVVDGDKVVQLGNHMDIVGVIHRRPHHLRVVIDIVVELLGARAKGKHLPPLIQVLVLAGDLARICDIHEGIHIHLGVNTQILQIRLGNHAANGVGHPADTQLQTGPVGDLGHYQVGHRLVHLSGLSTAA